MGIHWQFFLSSTTPERPGMPEKAAQAIRVLQYNTHLFIGTTVGLAPEYQDELRLGQLIKRLKSIDADIVGLNEVWADASKTKIVNALRREFPFSYFEPNHDITKIGSGLLLLSRHLISKPSYTKFKDLAGWDAMSQKGFYQAIVTLKLSDGGYLPVFVFISHAQSGNSADDYVARKSNLEQIRTAIRNAPFGTRPVLLFGDLNVIAEAPGGAPSAEYIQMRSMFDGLGLVDLCRCVYPDASKNPLYTINTETNNLARHFDPDHKIIERLDYSFVRNIGPDPATTATLAVATDWNYADPETGGFTDLSDHYPLIFSFVANS